MVHAFKNNGNFYLFDVESNNLFNVDEVVFCVVKNCDLDKFDNTEIHEANAQIKELKDSGLLFTESQNEV